jgi:hypothetical protein
MVVEMFLGGRCLVTWTDSDVTSAHGRTRVFHPPSSERRSSRRRTGTKEAPDRENGTMAIAESEPRIEDPEAVKSEWLGRLEALVRDVKGWAEAAGWRTRRITKTVNERRLGKYEVPVLLM